MQRYVFGLKFARNLAQSLLMEDFQGLDTHVLLEMLAKHTEEYTRMLYNHDKGEAFDSCKKTIFLLQTEINSRSSTEPPAFDIEDTTA